MTPEQKSKYLENPNQCPICESDSFRQDDSHYDGSYHWVYLRCNDCESQWTEEYKITTVWTTGETE